MTAVIKYKIKDKNQELHIFQDESPENPDDWHDDECFLVYKHRQFQVDRGGFDCREIFDYLNYPEKPKQEKYGWHNQDSFDDLPSGWQIEGGEEAFYEAIQEWESNKGTDFSEYHIFGVDAYIHSGIALSLAGKTNFPDRRWDVSTTGFVLVKKDLLKGSSIDEEDLTEEESITNYAEGLIKNWNTYLSGEVYGFKLFSIDNYWKISEHQLDSIANDNIINTSDFTNTANLLEELNEIDSCWGFYGSEYEALFDYLDLKKEELEEIK